MRSTNIRWMRAVENLGKVGLTAVLTVVYHGYTADVAFGAGSIRKPPRMFQGDDSTRR
jgi:hypothetical protein